MKEFSNLPFVSAAIDEGSTRKLKQLVINLENILYSKSPFPAYTCIMENLKTETYTQVLYQGLLNISKYNVKIGNVIIDGSLSQIKALYHLIMKSPIKWMHSLIITDIFIIPRTDDREFKAIKRIIALKIGYRQ